MVFEGSLDDVPAYFIDVPASHLQLMDEEVLFEFVEGIQLSLPPGEHDLAWFFLQEGALEEVEVEVDGLAGQ